MSIIEKKRIQFLDLAKGLCILQIVILHCLQPLEKEMPVLEFVGYVPMPLFYFLSGLFFKDKERINLFLYKRINKILIPFIAWYLISYLILYLRNFIFPTASSNENEITDLFFGRQFFNNPLWFLLSLFWCNIIFRLIQEWCKNKAVQLSVIIALTILGIFMSFKQYDNLFYFGTSLSCMPFFYLGYLIGSKLLISNLDSRKYDFIIMCGGFIFITIMAIIPVQIPLLHHHINTFSEGFPLIYYLFTAVFIVSVIFLCKFIQKIPLINYLGRYSIIVLITHVLIIYIANGILSRLPFKDIYEEYIPILDIVIVCFSMLLVVPICKRFLPYICAQKEVINTVEENKTKYNIV